MTTSRQLSPDSKLEKLLPRIGAGPSGDKRFLGTHERCAICRHSFPAEQLYRVIEAPLSLESTIAILCAECLHAANQEAYLIMLNRMDSEYHEPEALPVGSQELPGLEQY